MTVPIEFLDLDDVIGLASALFGDPPLVRDLGLLGAAVARPQTTLSGRDAYPDLWTRAAALLQSIVKNHALIDGNERLGWLATAVFLEINGAGVSHVPNDDVYASVMSGAGRPVDARADRRRPAADRRSVPDRRRLIAFALEVGGEGARPATGPGATAGRR